MADKKEEFLEIFDSRIRREGAQELRNYLLRSDFSKRPRACGIIARSKADFANTA